MTGIKPGYEQKIVPMARKRGRLALVASPKGDDGAVRIHADALMYAGLFDGEESVRATLDPACKAYVHQFCTGTCSVDCPVR